MKITGEKLPIRDTVILLQGDTPNGEYVVRQSDDSGLSVGDGVLVYEDKAILMPVGGHVSIVYLDSFSEDMTTVILEPADISINIQKAG